MESIKNTEGVGTREQKYILEIGVGNFTVYRLSEKVEERIESGHVYIAVDKYPEGLKSGDVRNPTIADIGALPFSDGSIHEMWLMNVFSGLDLDIYSQDENAFMRSVLRGSAQSPEVSKRVESIFHELGRVLDGKGEINIGEFYARIGDDLSWMRNISYSRFGMRGTIYEGENLKIFLRQHNFEEFMLEEIERYPERKPFFLKLTKLRDVDGVE